MKGQDPHPRAGQGLLVIWNDIEAGHEAEFREWHTREHMPERLAIPGFLHGRRLFSPTATPRWLTLYETASPDVLRSPAYLERLDAPSAWTRAVLPSFRDTARMPGRVTNVGGIKRGDEVVVFTSRTSIGASAEEIDEEIERIVGIDGVLGASLSQSDAPQAERPSAEEVLRVGNVGPPEAVLLLECAERLDATPLCGLVSGIFPDCLGVNYSLEHEEKPAR